MFGNLFNVQSYSNVGWILLTLGGMLLLGFLGTRITRIFRLPNVTAYIVVGVLVGPSVLNLFPINILSGMDFITDIALSFIAFSVGRYFRKSELKENGAKVIVITIFEALFAAIIVTTVMYLFFNFSLSFSLVLGAIASSTAPASTIMTIKQTKSKGVFVNTLLQVVALDDVVALLAYSIAIAISNATTTGAINVMSILAPLIYNLSCIVFGFVLGFVLFLIYKFVKNKSERLIILLAFVLLNGFICNALNVSPLLSCMILGMAYINFAKDESIFDDISDFSDPIMVIFFVYSGTKLSLASLATLGIPGVVYFFIRVIGKYAGASLGGAITKSDKSVTKYLGLALIPQAGVSIGLAAMGARLLPEELGNVLTTIILSSSLLYELVGPACAKLALSLSKSYDARAFKNKKQLQNEESDIVYNYKFQDTTQIDEKINNRKFYPNSIQAKLFHHNKDN